MIHRIETFVLNLLQIPSILLDGRGNDLFNSYQPRLSKCCRSVLSFDERHQPADSMRRCGVMGNTPTSHVTKKILTNKKTASRSTCCI